MRESLLATSPVAYLLAAAIFFAFIAGVFLLVKAIQHAFKKKKPGQGTDQSGKIDREDFLRNRVRVSNSGSSYVIVVFDSPVKTYCFRTYNMDTVQREYLKMCEVHRGCKVILAMTVAGSTGPEKEVYMYPGPMPRVRPGESIVRSDPPGTHRH